MKKPQIKEVKPTRTALQMADRSLKNAQGVAENILFKVKKFFLPTDFVILDMEEDENASIILGRSFLTTRRALIDVEKGELMLRVYNEQLVFNVFKIMHHSNDTERYIKIDSIDTSLQEVPNEMSLKIPISYLKRRGEVAVVLPMEDTTIKEEKRDRPPPLPPTPNIKTTSLGTNKIPIEVKRASSSKKEGKTMKKTKG
ncbi:uncharacterized protein LOC107616079 [Arachis ipaensis]|uniref:uncharacterized protein LOC107616079 n=1 Tax=Arachis ipaensis TaxID=130454 RepID=UPI0007AF1608|nr:uncharacterized protein LOC107616079 [Arachis ipaensis]XP_025678876.1 uncharacterized protein LOC112778807 [Arachis hypogaea]